MSKKIHSDDYIDRLRTVMGPRLKAARLACGLVQKTVAEQVGITDEFYSRIECGRAFPSVENLCRIADALDVSVDDLFGIEEHDPTPEVASEPRSRRIRYIVDRARDNPELTRFVVQLLKYCEGIERERGP